MATQPASRVNAHPVRTLADVLLAVQAADLPARRRQEIAAAVRTVARALSRPPERVSAEPRRLAALLTQVAPLAIGISVGRWANIRSLTRAGLALVQAMSPGRNITPLSPSWKALWRQLRSRAAKMALSRFVRFCSIREIEPSAVSEATFEAFRVHLDDTLLKSPDRVFAAMARGWRAAQIAVDSWPRVGISLPDRRNRWTLPWSIFPAYLRHDCNAWCDRLAGRDPVAEVPCRPVQASTVVHRERQIRSFASALVLRGHDPGTITSLSDLVQIEAFKEGLRFLIGRSGGKATTAVYDFASSLKAIARHHLRLEQAHLDQMTVIIRRLDIGHRGLTDTNRARLRQLDDPQNTVALLRLPHKLIGIAARNPRAHAGALQAQTAIAIEILMMAPMRLGNLVRLDIERHLLRPGRDKEMHIVIEPEDVKNREPLDYPLPPQSVELIARYERDFRPRLAPSGSTALFPGRRGGPKAPHTLAKQISETVHAYTGMRMHPHLFRHAMAKLFLAANPGQYETVRRVLAHRSISTTTNFYTGLETAAAVRHFDDTILRLRQSATAP